MKTRHPRGKIVTEAQIKLSEFMRDLVNTYELSFGEITASLALEILNWNKYHVEEERMTGRDGQEEE